MITYASRHWWLFLLRGVAAFIFGLLAWTLPAATLLVLVVLFGVYSLVDGVLALAHSFTGEGRRHRWSFLILGLLGCLAGVITLGWPGITALVLLFLIAAWAIFTGVFEVIAAFGLPTAVAHRWLVGVAGLVSVLFGIVLWAWPGAGLLTITWLLGFYGVVFGVIQIMGSFKLRDLPDSVLRDLDERAGRVGFGGGLGTV